MKNEVSVTGGGTEAMASTSEETLINSQAPPFGISELGFEVEAANGTEATQAGGHPWGITTSLELPLVELPAPAGETLFGPVENWKSVVLELPAGFIGDPQAVTRCTQTALEHNDCPSESSVGSVEVGAEFTSDEFSLSHSALTSALYNIVPEDGYPAEFGLVTDGAAVYLYASVVHTSSGYRLRVASPGLPGGGIGVFGGVFTFYGEPAVVEGESSEAAFLTNPTHCTTVPLMAKAAVESWENPGHPVSREATMYSELTGCNLLQSGPSLALAPSATPEGGTTQADEPSSYSVDLKLPQTSLFSELATPELENATVTLPEGVSVSPSAADGLAGCPLYGPKGINISGAESEEVGPDSLKRLAKGDCPGASTLGTVEVSTPLLPTRCGEKGQPVCKTGESPAPLQGHVYLAQPECGGAGQPECTSAYAEGKGGPSKEGKLFGLYLEVEGSGIIIKLPGAVSANPATGQLQATFKENPQFPFSELKLQLKGGPRAPLANPQSCGSFTTTSVLSSWAGMEQPVTSPSFNVDWDGNGGACPASLPFAPTFTAGTITPNAGGSSSLSVTFSRHDREQDLSAITLNTPPGLLGMISQVQQCPEPQASAGTCSAASMIGHTEVAVGSGSHPFWVGGEVFLTGPYKGAPFGLSIVTHAQAGPFNLGNVIVRAAIHIDPHTAAVSVLSDPLPQIIDGVPLRIQTVNVTVDHPGFILNPTNCNQQQITATITAAQGASANVASPFAVGGCKTLPFKPTFSASTKPKKSKVNGTSLHVVVTSPSGQANIASVHVELPKKLPSRLTTLHNACPEATFNANPGSCPAGSNVGTATATTPVLNVPLTGPAYLVSHGGAAFPDLVVVLRGEGVTIDLTGATNIVKGITSSTFSSLPDAPISHFELTLPQGPDSVLTSNGNICTKPLKMPTTITGQNGAQVKQSTRIRVSGCPRKHKPRPHHKKKR